MLLIARERERERGRERDHAGKWRGRRRKTKRWDGRRTGKRVEEAQLVPYERGGEATRGRG